MTLLKVRADKLKFYQAGLVVGGMGDGKTVAAKMKCSLATGGRLWNGGPVGRKLMIEILRLTKTKPDERVENNAHQLERVVSEYCEVVSKSDKPVHRTSIMRETSQEFDGLKLMTAYVKFVQLRDPRSKSPIYEKSVLRLDKAVPIYSERLCIYHLDFYAVRQNHCFAGVAANGAVELQPIFPATKDVSSGLLRELRVPDIVEHLVVDKTQIAQAAITYLNDFTPDSPTILIELPNDCRRLVVIVDTSSIVINESPLMLGEPIAYRKARSVSISSGYKRMSCERTGAGAYMVDSDICVPDGWNSSTDRLEAKDEVEIRLSINWDAVLPKGMTGRPLSDSLLRALANGPTSD